MGQVTAERHGSVGRPGVVRRLERTSLNVVSACVGLIGVYAVAALVIAPEGDPSVRARLLAAGAAALGAAIAVATGRWAPRWARGVVMLMSGFVMLGVFCGVVLERLVRRPSLSAFLGAIAGVASVVLIVAGWRRALVGLRSSWLRGAIAVLGSLLIAQFLLLPSIGAIVATNRARPLGSGRTPADVGLAFRDVRIAAGDGTRLAAWWVESRNGAAVILLPGSGSTRDDVLGQAAVVAKAGYGALLLDPPGHGGSGGRLMDFGWGGESAVRSAVSWVLERPGVTNGVALLGLSMGGEIALTTAAEDPRVRAVVAEGVTARTWRDVDTLGESNPVARANAWLEFRLAGVLADAPEPVPLLEAIGRIDVPVLLIEGDGPLEVEAGGTYSVAAPERVTLWSLPDTAHVQALSTHPIAYRTRVLALLDAAMP